MVVKVLVVYCLRGRSGLLILDGLRAEKKRRVSRRAGESKNVLEVEVMRSGSECDFV